MFTFETFMEAVENELSHELKPLASVWQEHLVLEDALSEWKGKQSLSDEDALDEDQVSDLIQDLASYLKEYEDFENTPIYTPDIHNIWNENTNECENAFFSVMSLGDVSSIQETLYIAVKLFCNNQARQRMYDASEKMSNFAITYLLTIDDQLAKRSFNVARLYHGYAVVLPVPLRHERPQERKTPNDLR